jgi:methionyl-tRNA formyltransferase
MTTILLCNSDTLAIPAALFLHSKGMLAAVVIPDRSAAILQNSLEQAQIPANKIYVVSKKNMAGTLSQLVTDTAAALITALTFPWRLPDTVLSLPAQGCINFHFGLLPRYQGADPVFWQLRNGEKEGGITVHRMTSEIDAGPVLFHSSLPIMPGETYGIHCERLGQAAIPAMNEVITRLQNNTAVAVAQERTAAAYYHAPDAQALTIQWQQQSAAEIIQLVNACNPRYGGAATLFRDTQVTLLEVLPVEVNSPPANVLPGTIVHADLLYGIIAACADHQYIRINIVQLREGYLSGSKLVQMGWRAGERFIS